jgi:hypothetical protein
MFADPMGVADSGPITADTRRALTTRQGLSAAEMMRMLQGVGREGVSNLESLARGPVATTLGMAGDVESIFRDGKTRLPTSQDVAKAIPRVTTPTKEGEGFFEVGSYMPIPPQAAKGTAKAMMAAMKSSKPQLEAILEKGAGAAAPMYAIPREGSAGKALGQVDNLLSDYREMVYNIVPLESVKRAPMVDMISNKAKDYFYNTYGTANDPIRKAVKEGRIPMFDIITFENYADTVQKSGISMRNLLGKARSGDEKALATFEKLYDDMTGLKKQVTKEGKEFYDLGGKFDASFPFLSRGQLVESLSTLSPDQLKKLSFPEAVVLGTENYLKKIDPSRGSNVVFFPKKP